MKCNHCPVRPGLSCVGEHHRPVCRDVESGLPGRAAQLVAMAEGPLAPGRPAPSAADLRLAMAADLCPSGAGPCGCGSAPRLCGHPDRPAERWRQDCAHCVTAGWWEAGVEAGW